MADIYDITQPLKGYNLGGPAGMTDIDRTGYDRSKSGAWNINDLVRDVGSDIGTSIKSKISGVGERIKDFAKYGWGDKERFIKIGGDTYHLDDPNFIRFIKNNYQTNSDSDDPEDFIEGLNKFREMVESEKRNQGGMIGYNTGGIVSLNHLTRRL